MNNDHLIPVALSTWDGEAEPGPLRQLGNGRRGRVDGVMVESAWRVTPSHPGAFSARGSRDVSAIFCVIIFLLAFSHLSKAHQG